LKHIDKCNCFFIVTFRLKLYYFSNNTILRNVDVKRENIKSTKQSISKQLQQIPGVGSSIAEDFMSIGINSIKDLKDKNPEKLYNKLCDFKSAPVDRCMLYVIRCAVYYASNENHAPDLLKWWNWKDKQ